MWLLNTREITLSWFQTPSEPYAILSHTWDLEEVTHDELRKLNSHRDQAPPHPIASKAGYHKTERCCAQAARDGFDWVWIDTCCIDKTSSAELSEAVNSMFRWYKESKVCYVYLNDVAAVQDRLDAHNDAFLAEFRKSKWFTRGWTLQELLAPDHLQFFSKSWASIGDRLRLGNFISEITGIPPDILNQRRLSEASIAQRMAWAANRKTTRGEDMAYCLLGIFDVNMPLLYGEGADKAFSRLQEEIIRQTDDQSIFAWGFGLLDRDCQASILAKSPSDFAGCNDVIPCRAWKPVQATHFEITKRGLHIELPIIYVDTNKESPNLGVLNCRLVHDFSNLIAIPINSMFSREGADLVIEKFPGRAPSLCKESNLRSAKIQTVYIRTVKSATAILTPKSFFRSEALIQGPQDLVFRNLHVDASLESVVRGDHIHVHESAVSAISHSSPTLRRAYFYYWTEGSYRDDFLVKLEFFPKHFITCFFLKVMGKEFANWKARCFIAKPCNLLPEYQLTPESLESQEWSQSIINGRQKITVHVTERPTLGSPMSIVTLRRTPLKQTSQTGVMCIDACLQLNLIFWSAVTPLSIKNGPPIKFIVKALQFFSCFIAGLGCLAIAIYSTHHPVGYSQGAMVIPISFCLALGFISISACFFQPRLYHDGTISYRRLCIFTMFLLGPLTLTIHLTRSG